MFNSFRKDPNYLTKYHLTVAAILFALNVTIAIFHPPTWTGLAWFAPAILLMTSTELKTVMIAFAYVWIAGVFQADFSFWNLLAVVPAVLLTFPFTSWIHSPAHGSLRPKWLNRPIGEIMGVVQLAGFPDWAILHVFHHSYPDHPELDPHPPLQLSYWKFAFGMRAQIGKCFMNHYFKYFGQNETSVRRLKLFLKAAKLNMLMKVSFWFLVLGPQIFSYFFVSSILFKMIHYAWFNYATHKLDADGKYAISNLDYAFYRWINWTASGLYYHGNHHSNPMHHNPQKIPADKIKTPSPTVTSAPAA